MVTVAPLRAVVGVKDVITGGDRNVNPAYEPVPPGVVTATPPEAEPGATTAVSCEAETTVNEVAGTPPKVTDVTCLKLVPLTVSVVPAPAAAGVNDVTVGV